MNDSRQSKLQQWVSEQAANRGAAVDALRLTPVSGDASFRRYFRVQLQDTPYIAVDAPPEHEDNPRFLRISELFRASGVMAPEVIASDFDQGFMLLEDFGDDLYLGQLLQAQQDGDQEKPGQLYGLAIDALVKFQAGIDKEQLDPYDRNQLHMEMALFDEWFCPGLLGLELGQDELDLINNTYEFLEDAALAQPVVAVHRDYHSRNLMIPDARRYQQQQGPGIVDFQDAVAGAYSYDLVSLLRDCYISWPADEIWHWAAQYHGKANDAGLLTDVSLGQLRRDMDLMGLQRHLKVLGIFSRLAIRDKKPRYLADIPLVMRYFLEVADGYPELATFLGWFRQQVLPIARVKFKLEF